MSCENTEICKKKVETEIKNQVKWKRGFKMKVFNNYMFDFERTDFKVL